MVGPHQETSETSASGHAWLTDKRGEQYCGRCGIEYRCPAEQSIGGKR